MAALGVSIVSFDPSARSPLQFLLLALHNSAIPHPSNNAPNTDAARPEILVSGYIPRPAVPESSDAMPLAHIETPANRTLNEPFIGLLVRAEEHF